MTPGAQGTKPGDKNQNALPLAQRILQDLHFEEPEISPNTSTETLREAEGGAPALILEVGADKRKEEEDDGEDAEEDVKVDVEEGAKEDKNQNSLPDRKFGPSRSNSDIDSDVDSDINSDIDSDIEEEEKSKDWAGQVEEEESRPREDLVVDTEQKEAALSIAGALREQFKKGRGQDREKRIC